MTPLRRRMIDDMTLRNFTPQTIQAYVRCVARFAQHSAHPPTILAQNTFAPTCSTSSRSNELPSVTISRTVARCDSSTA